MKNTTLRVYKYISFLIFYQILFWLNVYPLSVLMLSCVWLFATLCTIACQAPLFIGFSRQKYWSVLSFSPPGNLPEPGTESASPVSPALRQILYLLTHWGSLQWGEECINQLDSFTMYNICIWKHHDVHFKYLTILSVNCTSIKLKNKYVNK